MQDLCSFGPSDLPLVMTAIHAGHEVRPSLAARMTLDEATRTREEDPFTDRLTAAGGASVVVHRSRFEVDLNRPRDEAVYTTPDSCWGLELWAEDLPEEEVEKSLALHDEFYSRLAVMLDGLAARGPFVVLDLHSYNHRREGADGPPAPEEAHPEVNVGTGSVDRERWAELVDHFIRDLGSQEVQGHRLDVRENVCFRGRQLGRFVNERYDGVGCALSLEFKKVFMDEWTGIADEVHVQQLIAALAGTVPTLLREPANVR